MSVRCCSATEVPQLLLTALLPFVRLFCSRFLCDGRWSRLPLTRARLYPCNRAFYLLVCPLVVCVCVSGLS